MTGAAETAASTLFVSSTLAARRVRLRVRLGAVVLPGESPHAPGSIGHEFIGRVEDVGAEVDSVRPGDLVIAPTIYSGMSCPHCRNGSTISCVRGGNFGDGTIEAARSKPRVSRSPGTTLVPVPGSGPAPARAAALAVRSWWTKTPSAIRAHLRCQPSGIWKSRVAA